MVLLRAAIAGLLLLPASGSHPAQDAPPPAKVPGELPEATRKTAVATLGQVSKRLEKVVELHADYAQEQESLLLAEPIVSTGRFHLRVEPATLVLDLDQPAPARIRSDSVSHRVFDPGAKRAELFLFDENRLTSALIACFRADLEQVEQTFDLVRYWEKSVPREGEPDQQLAGVGLRPKAKELRAVIAELELVVDRGARLPLRVTQVNPDGEAVRFKLSGVQLLEEPSKDAAAVFDAPLPEGTRVVKRRIEAK